MDDAFTNDKNINYYFQLNQYEITNFLKTKYLLNHKRIDTIIDSYISKCRIFFAFFLIN